VVYDPRLFRSGRGAQSRADGGPHAAAASAVPGWVWVFVIAAAAVVAAAALHQYRQRDAQPTTAPAPTQRPPISHALTPSPTPQTRQPAMAPGTPVVRTPPPAVQRSAEPYTSVYLCRTWQGAQFWSAQHCQEHQATLLRLHRVSSALPWPQQVEIAREEARIAAQLQGR
jgi:hypothetical protein